MWRLYSIASIKGSIYKETSTSSALQLSVKIEPILSVSFTHFPDEPLHYHLKYWIKSPLLLAQPKSEGVASASSPQPLAVELRKSKSYKSGLWLTRSKLFRLSIDGACCDWKERKIFVHEHVVNKSLAKGEGKYCPRIITKWQSFRLLYYLLWSSVMGKINWKRRVVGNVH